ncbi:sugar phosphate nucleotidyltransferase [uncultured Halopseudomonas sp.]|uniref:sugar phosphate nucleotidyltransferase n=1 Tax=uncultured Halopseudomonas sp. TaxID=2901193 RepID=UPI0030EBA1A8|tara:strand:+ start:15786 stop:16481 length:696 start_codon:yes stop_codon:yes gene_type:complete
MRAYVLCGGLGTRLHSVTKGGQKALVDVRGEPFLLLLLKELRAAGIHEAVLCAGHRADQLQGLLESLASEADLRLHLVVEESPLGTGGALLHALQHWPVNKPYLVLNADTYLSSEAFSLLKGGTHNLILAADVAERKRYGSLCISTDGRVLALREKGRDGAGPVNAGVYCFTADALTAEHPRACSMELDILPGLIEREQLFAIHYGGPFVDIGTPASLAAFTESEQWSLPR